MQGGPAPPEDLARYHGRVPMDTNIAPGLVEAHAKGHGGSTGAVEKSYQSLHQSKRILVSLEAVYGHTGGIHNFDVSIVDTEIGQARQQIRVIRS